MSRSARSDVDLFGTSSKREDAVISDALNHASIIGTQSARENRAEMNEAHNELCSSPEWAEYLATDVLPKVLDGADLGEHLIEIGPGFGLATDVLMTRVGRVTSVEIDPQYAANLEARFAGSNVEIVRGDRTTLTFADGSFSSAACFTMLHHIPTAALQDQLFSEVARVLQPGAVFIGSDSLDSDAMREFHKGDTLNPIDPSRLPARLEAAGFNDVKVTVEETVPGEPGIEPYSTVFFVARTPRR